MDSSLLLNDYSILNHNFDKERIKALARQKFIYYIAYKSPWYQFKKHHILICHYLQKWIDGEIENLMMSTPPRGGKTELCGRNIPSFLLGYERTCQDAILLGTFDKSLSGEIGEDVRRYMALPEYQELFPDIQTLGRSDVGTKFNTTAGGGFRGIGKKSFTTGRDGTWLIFDDMLSGLLEAKKKENLINLHQWYTSVFEARETQGKTGNKPRKLGLSTRWAEDDLIGWILKNEPEEWTYINIPALCEDPATDILGRELDESIWEENAALTAAKLKLKRKRDPLVFSKVFQGNPTPASGNFFKPSKTTFYIKTDPEFFKTTINRIFISCSTPDYELGDVTKEPYCFSIWYETEDKALYLVKANRLKNSLDVIYNYILTLKTIFKPSKIVFDSNERAVQICDLLATQNPEILYEKVKGKSMAIASISKVVLQSPQIKILDHDLIRSQLKSFPNSTEDDIIRSISNFVTWYSFNYPISSFSSSRDEILKSLPKARIDKKYKKHYGNRAKISFR